jgi:flagellin-like protein
MKNKIVSKSKNAQSGVIAAVLLILVVIVSALVVMSFVVPFVRDKLDGTGCLDVAGKMEITNNLQYTCYNSSSDNLSVQIHYGDIANLTRGFQISVGVDGGSKSFNIPDDNTSFVMYGGGTNYLPGNNEERTYILGYFTEIPDSIKLYPILSNGDACDVSDTVNSISYCTSAL